ncbi:peptidylprolyl isomerase, partial [Bacillus cereus]
MVSFQETTCLEAPCAVPSVPCPDESVFFVRRLLAILLPALLLITACGGSNPA